jgi:hypothetical protein
MTKQSNQLFLKELISLGFPFTHRNVNQKEILGAVTTNYIFKKTQYNILDIFKLNNSLKQFIRIINSLKMAKNQKSKFLIYIWCRNPFILNLIQLYSEKYGISKYLVLCSFFPVIDAIKTENTQKFLFVLGNPWTQQSKKMLNSRVLFNRLFLVNTLNFTNEKPQLGFYKIQNDLADYKKLIVLLVIIDKVLKNTK